MAQGRFYLKDFYSLSFGDVKKSGEDFKYLPPK
jgi:hypothetical protein